MIKHFLLPAVKSFWFLSFSTVLVITLLVFLSLQQAWRYHLEVDIWGFYYPRLTYFLDNFSFANFRGNEYFPGAMFFFLIPGFSLIWGNSWETYLVGLFIVNIVLIITHLILYRKIGLFAPYIFLSILIFSGPIILYRHDLFVSLFVLLSIILWQVSKKSLAPFLLGIATSIKIFPILILPYFLLLTLKSKNMFESLKVIAYYTAGLLLVFGLYMILGSSITDIIEPMRVNSIKPVHVESLWGSLLTLINFFSNGFWPIGKGEHGIFGIHPNDIFLPLNFYNYFWIIPIAVLYFFLGFKGTFSKALKTETVFLIILLFVIFSKILTPQYLFWLIPLFPLINFSKTKTYVLSVIAILIISFLTQYVYPLHYSELLGIFYASGARVDLFIILLLRNVLLIILFILIYRSTLYESK